METVDLGAYFVVYNFVIGVLLMLASEKLAAYAGHLGRSQSAMVARYTKVGVFTFGAMVAALSATIYIAFHLLRFGV